MRRLTAKRSRKAGLPPGSLVPIGAMPQGAPRMRALRFGAGHVQELPQGEVPAPGAHGQVTWVDVEGVHDPELIQRLGEIYGLHPLVREDILNTDQRPKVEDYGGYVYVVLKALTMQQGSVHSEQVSLVLGRGWLLTFQEAGGGEDLFAPVRSRLKAGGRMCALGSDFLAYALMDALVDGYFIVLETLGERIEALEESLLQNYTPEAPRSIHALKREMLFLRRAVWPLREVALNLERHDSGLVGRETALHLRDVYDHVLHIMDTVEALRDALTNALEVYLSAISLRMNDIVKVLTVISTTLMPLTFLAGVYGMNFRHMPELDWPWAYPALLAVMAGIGGGMLLWFRRKRWI